MGILMAKYINVVSALNNEIPKAADSAPAVAGIKQRKIKNIIIYIL